MGPRLNRSLLLPYGLYYAKNFLRPAEREELLQELRVFRPIWEWRHRDPSAVVVGGDGGGGERSPEKGEPPSETGNPTRRSLLRPVYWLGQWQFACLNYYRPPKGIDFRCVDAEEFPPFLQRVAERIEAIVHQVFRSHDIPKGWHLNSCLMNYYGCKRVGDRWIDTARVGEHKDYEPGPIASLSFGDRALFQFVASRSKKGGSRVVRQMWLEDSAVQIFGSDTWKKKFFHRVQRVEKKMIPVASPPTLSPLLPSIPDFHTRRLNLTLRYVPTEHVQSLHDFPPALKADIVPYVAQIAKNSPFFAQLLSEFSSN
ncbi:MAG: alpha-ketoglutarate-dependent dioxygenase AlkB [Bdellovibrio sp.]|nr:MAG: alpha-ketoglutarate-dependent dioxygenase AlkB [Bdellovibrio sp.]